MAETPNSQHYWPPTATEYLVHIPQNVQDIIQQACSIDWNRSKTIEDEWIGEVYSTISPGTFLEGRYRISPASLTYSVVFEYSDPSLASEGVYHNDDPFACQELCREDLLVRLAKLSLGILKASKRETETTQSKTKKQVQDTLTPPITFL